MTLFLPLLSFAGPCERLTEARNQIAAARAPKGCQSTADSWLDLRLIAEQVDARCELAVDRVKSVLETGTYACHEPVFGQAEDSLGEVPSAIQKAWRDPDPKVYALYFFPDGGGVDLYENEGITPACRASAENLLGLRQELTDITHELDRKARAALITLCPQRGRVALEPMNAGAFDTYLRAK